VDHDVLLSLFVWKLQSRWGHPFCKDQALQRDSLRPSLLVLVFLASNSKMELNQRKIARPLGVLIIIYLYMFK